MYSKILRQFSKGSLISIFVQAYLVQPSQTIFFVSRSECLLVLLAAVQLYVLVIKHEIFQLCQCYYTYLRGHSHMESSPSLHENDAKFQLQTHPPGTLHIKMPNLPKINVFNFRYKKYRNFNEAFLSFIQVHK